MDKPNLPKNLAVVSYVPTIAEYAGKVRQEILKRKEKDFIIAVDYPAGLEKIVMEAVKRLPEVSLVVDSIKRAIRIVPTSAPVEAVRSYLEYGHDIQFIDASLPVIGNRDDYHYFVDLCQRHGIDKVLKDPESLGISKKDLEKSWKDMMSAGPGIQAFYHLPETCTIERDPENKTSSYRHTRLQQMAARLQGLLEGETEVLLVIALSDWNDLREYLAKPQPPVDRSIVLPAKIAMITEQDVPRITYEIPYVMYLYEIYRDTGVGREEWLHTILEGTDLKNLPVDIVRSTADYSSRVALANRQVYPDLYDLVMSARHIGGDTYARPVFELAISYPPAEDTLSDYRFSRAWDHDFNPLENDDVLAIIRVLNDNPVIIDYDDRIRGRTGHYYRWTRTDESYRAELEFMRYMTSHFTIPATPSNNYEAHELVCGFGEGIDIRETIRNRHIGKMYVREEVRQNIPTYVFDYRSLHEKLVQGKKMFPIHIFMDKYHPWIGIASSMDKHHISRVMVAFPHLDFSPTKIFGDIRTSDQLGSAVDIALKYSNSVLVFTDSPGEINWKAADRSRLKTFPCRAIPGSILELMATFDIDNYRYDDCPGD